jgi:hypothetical protein
MTWIKNGLKLIYNSSNNNRMGFLKIKTNVKNLTQLFGPGALCCHSLVQDMKLEIIIYDLRDFCSSSEFKWCLSLRSNLVDEILSNDTIYFKEETDLVLAKLVLE